MTDAVDHNQSDATLARLACEGDRVAATVLVDRYQTPVRLFLRRLTGDVHLADDLTQDTLLRMLRYAGRYDPNWPMKTWLLTIARRLWIDHIRRHARRNESPTLTYDLADPSSQADPIAETERTAILNRAIQQLSETQRCAVILFYQQQMSLEETATIMEQPQGTIKSHLHRARAKLREQLEPHQESLT